MLTGQCLCGAVKFILKREVKQIAFCHCKYCRRAHGSAFASSTLIRGDDFEVESGLDKIASYGARYFCSVCASRLYNRSPPDAPYMNLMVSTLDIEPSGELIAHMNVASKAHWFRIGDGGVQYPEFPSQKEIVKAMKELK